MQFHGELKLDAKTILKSRGLDEGGRVQKVVDMEIIKFMAKYTPFESGLLEHSALLNTQIGSGLIRQVAPQARYDYYGILMVSSVTGSAWASKREKKVLTDKDLEFSKANHPLAGPFWFERSKADNSDKILKAAQEEANRGAK
jgi:hypothetical protein